MGVWCFSFLVVERGVIGLSELCGGVVVWFGFLFDFGVGLVLYCVFVLFRDEAYLMVILLSELCLGFMSVFGGKLAMMWVACVCGSYWVIL